MHMSLLLLAHHQACHLPCGLAHYQHQDPSLRSVSSEVQHSSILGKLLTLRLLLLELLAGLLATWSLGVRHVAVCLFLEESELAWNFKMWFPGAILLS